MPFKTLLKSVYKLLPFKREFFSLIRRFYSPSHKVYQHLHFRGWLNLKAGKRKFRMYHYGFQLENELFWKGVDGWEPASIAIWSHLCKRSEIILDIGANTGVFALIAKTLNSQSRVLAFEPVRRVFEKLERNIRKNGFDIEAFELALSDADGHAVIYDQPTDHIYSVTVNKNLAHATTSVIPVTIPTAKLSTIIDQRALPKIDLIKLDVETHEPEVLMGMEKCITTMQPVFIIELLDDDVASRVERLMSSYRFYKISEKKNCLIPLNAVRIIPGDGYNYLALPESRVDILRTLPVRVQD